MPTEPDDHTTAEDERDAHAGHEADRPPTEEEEAAAERDPAVPPSSSKAYKEAIERGAAVKGEGQIDP
jgi:hypothetical protein